MMVIICNNVYYIIDTNELVQYMYLLRSIFINKNITKLCLNNDADLAV